MPTSCAATESFPAWSCHGFWSVLRSCCQSSNNSHHLLSCFSRHFANICQLDGFFQTLLWASFGAIYQTMEHNFIWKGYLLISILKANHVSNYIQTDIALGFFFPPHFFFKWLSVARVTNQSFFLWYIWIYMRHVVQETLLIMMRSRYLWMP